MANTLSHMGFFDQFLYNTIPGLLATNGVRLSQRGKWILVEELDLVERPTNEIGDGIGT